MQCRFASNCQALIRVHDHPVRGTAYIYKSLECRVVVEAQAQRPVLAAGQGGIGGIVQGQPHGALALLLRDCLHLGYSQFRIIQIDRAAQDIRRAGQAKVRRKLVWQVPDAITSGMPASKQRLFVWAQVKPAKGRVLAVKLNGHRVDIVLARVKHTKLDRRQRVHGQGGEVRHYPVYLRLVGICLSRGIKPGLFLGYHDGHVLLALIGGRHCIAVVAVGVVRVDVVIQGALDDRLYGVAVRAGQIGVVVVHKHMVGKLGHVQRRRYAGAASIKLHRAQDAVLGVAVLIHRHLRPDYREVGYVAYGRAGLGELEVAVDKDIRATRSLFNRVRESVGQDALAVESRQADVAEAVPHAVPAQNEARLRVELRHGKLRVLVQPLVTGDNYARRGLACRVYYRVAYLVVRRVAGVGGVQRIGHSRRAVVRQHGRCDAPHRAGCAAVKPLGRRPASAVIDAVHDVVLLGEVQEVVVIRGINAAPGHKGPAVTVRGYHRGQVRQGVVGKPGRGPGHAVIYRGHNLRAVHHQPLLGGAHRLTGVLGRQGHALAHPRGDREVAGAGQGMPAVAKAGKAARRGNLAALRIGATC